MVDRGNMLAQDFYPKTTLTRAANNRESLTFRIDDLPPATHL